MKIVFSLIFGHLISCSTVVLLKLSQKPMFWIHGGAFTGGTGADPTFGGGNMESRGDVVMVAIRVQLCNHLFIVLHDTGRGLCRCETDPQCYWLLRPYNATRLFESL